MPSITKERVMSRLGDKLLPFAAYCLSDDPEAPVVKWLFENMEQVNPHDPAFQGMLQLLLYKGVIDQACVERFDEA